MQNDEIKNAQPLLQQHTGSSSFFDHEGNDLKTGDVFEYSRKKWKSKARIVECEGVLGVLVTQRDMPDKFVPLQKYLSKCRVVKYA